MILVENIHETNLTGNELKNYRRKKKILTLLYHNDTLSATYIAKKIGVSLPTAISLLKDLTNLKFVEVCGSGESKGGRRPTLFGLKNDNIFVIACELGRYKAKIGIYDSHNQLVAPVVVIETNMDDDEMVNKVYENSLKIINDNQIDVNSVFGIGLAMPGLVDAKEGINYTIKKKEYQNVKERLEQKLGKLVYINNDARMQAYGEFVFGQAKDYQNALIINWNWGVGLGIIINGKLYNGGSGFAGELSHIKFVEKGDLCICGKRGCLETVISAYVLINKAKEAIKEDKVSQLTAKFKGNEDQLKVEDIIKAAKSGDEFSISLLNSVGQAFGKALANTIQLFNPEIIVLGGLVSSANQFVLAPIQQSVNHYCLEHVSGNTKIVISDKWEQTGLLGVTAKLFQKLFSDMLD